VQDEVEADGGGLRVPEALLRDADGGEPAAAEGAGRAPRAQDGAPLLHAAPGHHPLHVPVLRARRLQLIRPRRTGGARVVAFPCCYWHCGVVGPGAAEALVVRGSVLVPAQPPAGRPRATSTAGAGQLVMRPSASPPATRMDGEGSAVNTLTFFLLPFLLFSLHAVLGIFLWNCWWVCLPV